MSSAVIDVANVSKSYKLGTAVVPAVRGVSLQLYSREMVGLAGPSGSGKSTLLHLVGCLDRPDSGEIHFGDERVSHLPARVLTGLRRERLGFVFQSFNLLPMLTAAENVAYPLLLTALPGESRRRRVDEMLSRVGLSDKAKHRPHQLSGGERQRVAVARALVNLPQIVVADEPTANLDTHTGAAVLDTMEVLRRELGVTFLVASHDPQLLRRMDRVVTMRDGAVETGTDVRSSALQEEATCA
jgi:putative ABC transport system ATP-binding protein